MRSYLYVPADNARFLEKAETSEADAIILDLEDSVKVSAKNIAEGQLSEFLSTSQRINLMLRVEPNRISFEEELINHPKITKIYLPKANSLAAVQELNKHNKTNKAIHALIESSSGIENISEIATADNVVSLGIGEADFFGEISLSEEIHPAIKSYVRSKVVIASAAFNLRPPVAPVSSNFKNLENFADETKEFLAMGYWGRACIHPSQVEIANEIFTPNSKLKERAQKIIALMEHSQSGATVDDQGQMIDVAHLKWARRYLDLTN